MSFLTLLACHAGISAGPGAREFHRRVFYTHDESARRLAGDGAHDTAVTLFPNAAITHYR